MTSLKTLVAAAAVAVGLIAVAQPAFAGGRHGHGHHHHHHGARLSFGFWGGPGFWGPGYWGPSYWGRGTGVHRRSCTPPAPEPRVWVEAIQRQPRRRFLRQKLMRRSGGIGAQARVLLPVMSVAAPRAGSAWPRKRHDDTAFKLIAVGALPDSPLVPRFRPARLTVQCPAAARALTSFNSMTHRAVNTRYKRPAPRRMKLRQTLRSAVR